MTEETEIDTDPRTEGITHINIHERSVFKEARILAPFYKGNKIKSIFGFDWDCIIRPISYLRFTDPGVFDELISLDTYTANKRYYEAVADEATCSRSHRRAIIYMLFVEKVLKDPEYAKALYLTGDYPLTLYKPVITIHPDGHSKMQGGLTNYLTGYLPGILAAVRRDLFTRGSICVNEHINTEATAEHFLSSLPKYTDTKSQHLEYIWDEMVAELVPLTEALLQQYDSGRSLEDLSPYPPAEVEVSELV